MTKFEIENFRNDQNSKIADLSSAIVQMKINIDILMSDFHNYQLEFTREIKQIHDQLEKSFGVYQYWFMQSVMHPK